VVDMNNHHIYFCVFLTIKKQFISTDEFHRTLIISGNYVLARV